MAAFSLALVLLLVGPSDVVRLTDGNQVEGRVLLEGEEFVVVRVDSKAREIPRAEIASVDSLEGWLRRFFTAYGMLQPGNASGLVDVARFCQARGLTDEARLCWLEILTLDPENEIANQALGGVETSSGWRIPAGSNRSMPLEKLRERNREWKNAWELETAHYRLRTNQELKDAIATALDLERFYLFFYDVIGTPIGLYNLEERVRAEVHADKRSYPQPPVYRDAWFGLAENTLHVNASGGLRREFLFHEAVHQLIWNGFRQTRARPGQVPAWADEGLAEYLSTGVSGPPGRSELSPGARHDVHFQNHGQADEPLSLDYVLNLGLGDFQSGSSVEAGYSQSYTLVHFLMHGDRGALRPRFLAFLRSALEGQGAATHFHREIGLEKDVLESSWHDYSRRIADGR